MDIVDVVEEGLIENLFDVLQMLADVSIYAFDSGGVRRSVNTEVET